MLFLLASIVFTSWLTLSFKLLEKYRISNFQTIVFNYWACVCTGTIMNGDFPIKPSIVFENWFLWAVVMGVTFIILFNLVAKTAQEIGVAVASVANKLSLVIPFVVSIFLYNEKASAIKLTGVVIAIISVVLTCWPQRTTATAHKVSLKKILIFPTVLFFGSGFLDTLIKYVEQFYLTDVNKNNFIITAFFIAGFIGICILLLRIVIKREKIDYRSVVAGIAIGVPNYFSIWCLIKVLKLFPTNSSAIIPINNMGIVLFSTLCAFLIFKERLSSKNWWGVGLALMAICVIAIG